MTSQYIDCHTHIQCENCIYNRKYEETEHTCGNCKYTSYGLHPWQAGDSNADEIIKKLKELIQNKSINFVGECGLDTKLCSVDIDIQIKYFKQQIVISEENNMPMVIHCVGEIDRLRRIRSEMKAKQQWIFHSFSSSYQTGNQLMNDGFVLSVGKYVLNRNNKKITRTLEEAYERKQLLLETDQEEGKLININDIYEAASERLDVDSNTINNQIEETISKLLLHQ